MRVKAVQKLQILFITSKINGSEGNMSDSKDVKEYNNFSTEKEHYVDIVKQWKNVKKEMMAKTSDERVMRWSYTNGMFKYFDNPGKQITDSNPYINIIDLEEFDLSIMNQPYPPDPPAFNNSNRLNFFGTLMDDFVDDSIGYKKHLSESYSRILSEAKGENLPPVADQKETDLVKLKAEIFEYAKSLGFASVGVTKVDRRFISVEIDDDIIYDTILILGYEIPHGVLHNYPNPKHDTAAYYGYSHCAQYVHDVADFIRAKGHDCRARSWEGFIKYPIHAVNAGMGNFSTFGLNHTPEAGMRIKYCSVIIDAELPLDKPRDFNIEEFCSRCRMCQKSCPAGAIPKEEMRYRGTIKRTTNHIKCFDAMASMHECMQCIRVCPISMIGYEQCMDSLPQYYQYNGETGSYDMEGLKQKKVNNDD